MGYQVQLISIGEKEELVRKYTPSVRFELKADIYGCCIKLLTGDRAVKEQWEESFYFISQAIRSHGRLYVVADLGLSENTVFYDPQSKTAFLINITYYGWVKSLALSVAGDVLEDEHRIYSVHGACLDAGGRGCCLIGASGAGKTTQTYGLMRDRRVRVIADDWFYARIFADEVFAYGSEKNFYIRADLATVWPEYAGLITAADFDAEGRAVVDLRAVTGKGRILPMTVLSKVIVLERRHGEPLAPQRPEKEEALAMLKENKYFNPHLLVQSPFKEQLREEFFSALLSAAELTVINTAGTPAETQTTLRSVLGLE
jgi:hypothetical protein